MRQDEDIDWKGPWYCRAMILKAFEEGKCSEVKPACGIELVEEPQGPPRIPAEGDSQGKECLLLSLLPLSTRNNCTTKNS